MACQRFAAAIRAHALGAPLAGEAAVHLAACPVCQAAFDIERRVLATINEALTDVASATPSLHFESRVRAHVEVAAPRWALRRWLIPSAAAALALLAVALLVPRWAPEPSAPREIASIPVEVPRIPAAGSTIEDAKPAGTELTKRRARRGHVRPASESRAAAAPEVLVPERERAAVGRLAASLRTGRPDVVSMLMRLRGGDTVSDTQALTIAPLRIDPVVISEIPGTAAILDK
jgi:hypothetical protein